VAQTGSFTGSAGRLCLRQCTVSQHIRKPERIAYNVVGHLDSLV
jgi:DNA-binding transcriptional LysR family regulator